MRFNNNNLKNKIFRIFQNNKYFYYLKKIDIFIDLVLINLDNYLLVIKIRL